LASSLDVLRGLARHALHASADACRSAASKASSNLSPRPSTHLCCRLRTATSTCGPGQLSARRSRKRRKTRDLTCSRNLRSGTSDRLTSLLHHALKRCFWLRDATFRQQRRHDAAQRFQPTLRGNKLIDDCRDRIGDQTQTAGNPFCGHPAGQPKLTAKLVYQVAFLRLLGLRLRCGLCCGLRHLCCGPHRLRHAELNLGGGLRGRRRHWRSGGSRRGAGDFAVDSLQVFHSALIASLSLLHKLLALRLENPKAPLIALRLNLWLHAHFRGSKCSLGGNRLLSCQKLQHLGSTVPCANSLLHARIALRQKRRNLIVAITCAARGFDLGA